MERWLGAWVGKMARLVLGLERWLGWYFPFPFKHEGLSLNSLKIYACLHAL